MTVESNNWADLAKTITSAISALAAIGATVLGWLNRKKSQRIYLSLNSRLDQLLKAEHARGRMTERQAIIDGIVPDPRQMLIPGTEASTKPEGN